MTIHEKLNKLLEDGINKGYTYVKYLECSNITDVERTYAVDVNDIIITFTHKNNGGAASGHTEYVEVISGGEVLLRLDDIPNGNSCASFSMIRATETSVTLKQWVHYSSNYLAIRLSTKPFMQ